MRLLIVFFLIFATPAFAAEATIEDMHVTGSDAFIKRTEEAMTLLHSTQSFAIIKPFIHNIAQGERSGMRAYDDSSYEVGDPTWQHSAMWYAGTIVHDGFHSKLYHEHKPWTGPDAEVQCLKIQADALREMHASASLIAYVENFEKDPRAYIGAGTKADYEKRNW